MKILAISEHYFPRLGGTVNYVHETLSALSHQGVEVELCVPGPPPEKWLPEGMALPPYEITWINAGYPARGEPTRDQRYAFSNLANDLAQARATSSKAPDVCHVMFGMFLMEVVETEALRLSGICSVATVHNVPPQECRLVAPDAPIRMQLKEEVRLQLVKWKNRRRLHAHRYDAVVVPSEQVRNLLAETLDKQTIHVIGHGSTGNLLACMAPPVTRRPANGAPARLLTVGGFAPHKRQHLIPDVAALLHARGIAFDWEVVGPAGRVAGYYDGILRAVERAELGAHVRIRSAVPTQELASLYDEANLYVQPSVEEGFCITALDAAACGLPVIASPAGALVQIARISDGGVVQSAPGPLAHAIADFLVKDRWGNTALQAQQVREQFSWAAAAQALRARYVALTK